MTDGHYASHGEARHYDPKSWRNAYLKKLNDPVYAKRYLKSVMEQNNLLYFLRTFHDVCKTNEDALKIFMEIMEDVPYEIE